MMLMYLSVLSCNDSKVVLTWDPSKDTNVAGYKLHYGTESRNYDKFIDVGMKTKIEIKGLKKGNTYYFSVSSYNPFRVESEYSNEVIYTVKQD